MVLVRQEIGDVLRDFRQNKGQTLRQVASRASVALGYLSEVERGQKEASSEILASLADALEVPVSVIMREVSDRLALIEGIEGIANEIDALELEVRELAADETFISDSASALMVAGYQSANSRSASVRS